MGMDALMADWNKWICLYLFPPCQMLLKVFEITRRPPGECVLHSSILAKSNLISAPVGEGPEVCNDSGDTSSSVSRKSKFLL